MNLSKPLMSTYFESQGINIDVQISISALLFATLQLVWMVVTHCIVLYCYPKIIFVLIVYLKLIVSYC